MLIVLFCFFWGGGLSDAYGLIIICFATYAFLFTFDGLLLTFFFNTIWQFA